MAIGWQGLSQYVAALKMPDPCSDSHHPLELFYLLNQLFLDNRGLAAIPGSGPGQVALLREAESGLKFCLLSWMDAKGFCGSAAFKRARAARSTSAVLGFSVACGGSDSVRVLDSRR